MATSPGLSLPKPSTAPSSVCACLGPVTMLPTAVSNDSASALPRACMRSIPSTPLAIVSCAKAPTHDHLALYPRRALPHHATMWRIGLIPRVVSTTQWFHGCRSRHCMVMALYLPHHLRVRSMTTPITTHQPYLPEVTEAEALTLFLHHTT